MQKEVLVTSCLILILLFNFNTLYSQQNLSGSYSDLEPLQEYYNYYQFDVNGNFEYHSGASLGDDKYGKGEYKLSDEYLILNYNKSYPSELGYHFSKVWKNDRDSITVNFKVVDFTNTPISGTNVLYANGKTTYFQKGIILNENGEGCKNFIKGKDSISFSISNVGFDVYRTILSKKYNYNVTVYLVEQENTIPILHQIDTLEVLKYDNKMLRLMDKGGKVTDWYKRN